MSFFKSTWYWPLLSLFGNSESIDSPFCCHLLICLDDRSTEYLKVISLGLLQCYEVHRRHSGDKWARYWTSLCARILASRGSTLPLPRAGRYAVPWPPCWQTMELPSLLVPVHVILNMVERQFHYSSWKAILSSHFLFPCTWIFFPVHLDLFGCCLALNHKFDTTLIHDMGKWT